MSSLVLTKANEDFIRNNYDKIPINEIVEATKMKKEDVLAFINSYIAYLEANNVVVDHSCNFTIAVDENGGARFVLAWDSAKSVEKIAPYLGRLFYRLNAGELKGNITQYLLKFAEANDAANTVNLILSEWAAMVKAKEELPMVPPNDVFGDVKGENN